MAMKKFELPYLKLSYETRRRLLHWAKIGLIVFAVLTVIWACWMVWLDRHIVYTRDGALVDRTLNEAHLGKGTLAVAPEEQIHASIYYDLGADSEDLAYILSRLEGYYIDAKTLTEDIDTVRAAVSVLPVGTAVMVELKNIKGNFYYSTTLDGAKTVSDVDIEAIDRLLADMNERKLYTIAMVPAFRDRAYGLSHTNNGLPYVGGGGALWLDDQNCYWLNPAKSGTLNYLQDIAVELRNLGFDEVMFTEFRFPDTDELDFSGDRAETLQSAAETLVEKCSTDSFAISFMTAGSTVDAVSGRSRLYVEHVEAADAASAAEKLKTEDPAVNVVFLTDSYDTRYEDYGTLRPISSFAGDE